MKPSSPAFARLVAALLVVSGIGLFVGALLHPRAPMQPLPAAQLAGSRTIMLEDDRPVYGFDDERLPIVVVPPTDGRWTARAVGLGESRGLDLVAEPVDERVRLRVQGPLPIGRWTLVIEDDARLAEWPVRFAEPPEESAAIAALKAQAEAAAVDARPAVWRAAIAGLGARDRIAARVEEARAWIAAGDLAAAATAYEAAAEGAGAIGWVSEQAGRLRAAAWALYRLRRFSDAQARLIAVEAMVDELHDAWARARLDYLFGCVLRETGMFRQATRRLRRSWLAARHFDDQRLFTIITDELASLLSDQGQHQSALALLAQTPPAGSARGRRLNIRGWIAARAYRDDRSRWPELQRDLEESLQHLEMPDARNIALTNLIGLDLQAGRLDAASRRVAEAEQIGGTFARFHLELFRAEIARRSGRMADAEARYRSLLAATRATLDDEVRWQAAFGMHIVARAAQDLDSAADWLVEAFSAIEQGARRAAVSEARATWLADRRPLIEAGVALYESRNESRAALALLDATRAWVLRDLEARMRVERLDGDARARWLSRQARYQTVRSEFDDEVRRCARQPADEQVTCRARLKGLRRQVEAAFDGLYSVLDAQAPSALADALLPELEPGSALFTAMRVGDETLGFWLQDGQIRSRQVDLAAPLSPFLEQLDSTEHLYLVPGGGVSAASVLDTVSPDGRQVRARLLWSELPFAGLLARPTTSAFAPPVVIADPTSDLEYARAEGQAVHRHVGGELLIGDAVTREVALEALTRGASLIHFAGHGALDAESPWQAHLALANGEKLTLADLLVAQPKVGIVVLSGCETGVRSALSTEHRVGLPDAFLLAGARAVIATDRVVPDADARAFIEHFYASPDWAERPAAAFARAVRILRAAGNPIWSAFRLMGRA